MWRKHKLSSSSIDQNTSLIIIFFVLIVFGFVMLSSASSVIGYTNFGDNYYYLKHQLLYGFLPGLFLFFLCLKIPYKLWQKNAVKIFLASLVLLALVFIPAFQLKNNPAKSWLIIANFSLQPSEIAKLALIIYLSAWFTKSKNHIKSFSHGLIPFAIFLSIVAVLVTLEPDIGTLIVIVFIAYAIYFAAGAKIKHFFSLLAISGVVLAGLIISAPYRFNRILTFLNPAGNTQDIGYHINQALLAVGSGGIFGLGLGQSRQKFEYLPEVAGDSIFAIIAEEIGFIFSLLFIILLIIFIAKILKISQNSPDEFVKLFTVGIGSWIGLQSLFNIGAMIGILPLTGVPLPFVSFGGTALMALMASFGILINMLKK
ncbi:putative lipid II flippase FtsW [Candidatus Kuenenbacteria bacterium CG23_combo_of_CG06-09_8_20_14_all_36_9]|uniref:Probable peptidoglycan glycosyltransferase FtsW n=1 Tax=Candidatus Kuenenbacteria bacterium CG10_big_fil_rev_8_21_14_0_10_36_11 TaxID=1974618 RepID=A0A2M6WAE0_9BACT|nr:MAG: putative lipid II flippase FtsW [Candidatus Kuenenbacteria bacterium CG23_combo_of_CG06-09_8_20_14_all_36_9]PIT89737.1 MAG: putative lipid II flippase FtsW [Candidatus Kuenenbacteria bacterium CG10_big_fil_rev_8_21_14_0_10_36_11]